MSKKFKSHFICYVCVKSYNIYKLHIMHLIQICYMHTYIYIHVYMKVYNILNKILYFYSSLSWIFFSSNWTHFNDLLHKTEYLRVGHLGVAQLVKHLPSARSWFQGPGIQPHVRFPAQRGVCFSLSLCLSALVVLSFSCCLSLSQINKIFKKKSTWG